MKRRLIRKKNMKIQILLTIIGAAALAAITINVNAGDTLLSPRAKGNEIKVVTSVANDVNLVAANRDTLLSPRATGNRITTAIGVGAAGVKCPMLGSPKYVAAVGKAARASCCGLTLAECPTMDKMGKPN